MSSFKACFGIDGTDGSGKSTAINYIKEKLEGEGHRVAVIDSPMYQSNSGRAVSEYLIEGYGCITDRKIASQLYAVDRNMYYRKYYNQIFLGDEYDVILFNRNWLSSIFYQTTLVAQTPEDTELCDDTSMMYPIIKACGGRNCTYASLAHMHDMIGDDDITLAYGLSSTDAQQLKLIWRSLDENDQRLLRSFYIKLRVMNVRRMIHLVYEMEVEPWKFYYKCAAHANFVLTTSTSPAGVEILRNNMMKRYGQDKSKMDRNEASIIYQLAVAENIEWIKKWYNEVCHYPYEPAIENDWRNHLVPEVPCLSIEEMAYFSYNIITTVNGQGEQLPPDMVGDYLYQRIKIVMGEFEGRDT